MSRSTKRLNTAGRCGGRRRAGQRGLRRGFAVDADGVGANVALAARSGIAGLSIEDSTHDESHPLFDLDLAVDRIRAARHAIDESARPSSSPDDPKASLPAGRISPRRFVG